MRFLSVYKCAETGTPPSADEVGRMMKLIEEGTKAGWLLATEGCLPSALGARVRKAGGRVTATDGPFVESKELIGGFALLEASSKEHAIELARQFLAVAGDGECEIRQLYTDTQPGAGNCAEVHTELKGQFAGK